MGGEVPFPWGIEVPFPWGKVASFMEGGWKQSEEFNKLPNANSCRKIDFDDNKVEVVPGIVNNTWFLVVGGMKPYANMKVELIPLIYVRQPEYWGIEVVGCLPGIGLPAFAPYTVTISLDGIIGTKGIEIVGASKTKKLKVPQN